MLFSVKVKDYSFGFITDLASIQLRSLPTVIGSRFRAPPLFLDIRTLRESRESCRLHACVGGNFCCLNYIEDNGHNLQRANGNNARFHLVIYPDDCDIATLEESGSDDVTVHCKFISDKNKQETFLFMLS